MREDRCRGCGRRIVWGFYVRSEDQQTIKVPLDPSAPVYRLRKAHEDINAYHVERESGAMVSHFKTCPKADQFTRRPEGASHV